MDPRVRRDIIIRTAHRGEHYVYSGAASRARYLRRESMYQSGQDVRARISALQGDAYTTTDWAAKRLKTGRSWATV